MLDRENQSGPCFFAQLLCRKIIPNSSKNTTKEASQPQICTQAIGIHKLPAQPGASTTRGANKAANKAGKKINNPPVPVEVCKLSAMEVNKPTGNISVVTTEKVAKPTAPTANQGCRLPGCPAMDREGVFIAKYSRKEG